jgi:hypothetical protein
VPLLSYLISCTPTKSNLYLANSLAAVVSEPALCRLLTLQVPNFMSPFRCLGRTKISVQVRGFLCEHFETRYVFTFRGCCNSPKPQAEDQLLSVAHDCLFKLFAATLHIGDRSSIRNMRTCHALVTGSHLSRWDPTLQIFYNKVVIVKKYINIKIKNPYYVTDIMSIHIAMYTW